LSRPASRAGHRGNPIRTLRLAVAFLTVVPVRLRGGEAPPLGTAAGWFAAVGALVGGLAGGVAYLAEPTLGGGVAAILAVAVLVGVTGALHEDGLADCADGLGVRGDRARRLEVMRDSAIGTFGALALILWALLVVSALAGLDREDALRALVVAAAVARWAALIHAMSAPPARPDGLGAGFSVGPVACAVATVTAAGLALALVGVVHAIVVVGVAAAVALLVTAWSRATIGGRTGDTLGATIAIAEAAVLVTLLGL
jgi:adenosylcobinamide-GDP ribazoletransferase